MNLKINKKTYEVKEYNTFKLKFKSLRFVFEPLDFIIKIPNKKVANTYFFVQRVDICFTDEVLERLLSEIYDEFAGNSIIEEAIDRVRQRYYENKEDLDNFYNHDYSKENLDKSMKKMFIKQKTSLT